MSSPDLLFFGFCFLFFIFKPRAPFRAGGARVYFGFLCGGFVCLFSLFCFSRFLALSVSLRSPALPHAGEPKRNLQATASHVYGGGGPQGRRGQARPFAPLSVMPQSGMTAPPRGEPSVPASIFAKSMVRQSCKKVHLTTKFSFTHGHKLGSPSGRAGERSETERGASPACGRGGMERSDMTERAKKKSARFRALSRLYNFCENEFWQVSGPALPPTGEGGPQGRMGGLPLWAGGWVRPGWPAGSGCGCGEPASRGRGRSRRRWAR